MYKDGDKVIVYFRRFENVMRLILEVIEVIKVVLKLEKVIVEGEFVVVGENGWLRFF